MDAAPRLAPKMPPASIGAIDWIVIGTGPIGIDGTTPITPVKAAIMAIAICCFKFMLSYSLSFFFYYKEIQSFCQPIKRNG
ncbi:hypothetical protein J26TS2_14480 [Shouchella clausii]|nr:hypothetical protein J26TS2_14480 [Shouchella clausii]